MKIFERLEPDGSDETLINAAELVVSRLYNIPSPRSLCEMQTDEEDYQWLRRWGTRLIGSRVQRWLDGISANQIALNMNGRNLTYAEAFGCLFLLLASEAARRDASEGGVWSTVRPQFQGSAETVLFLQGQPKEPLKDAMEAAARKIRLRHVYGREGTQEYYIGVYLQFGFTRKGMSRLAYWLAGQRMTESIRYLTGVEGESLKSKSFLQLWDALRSFRRNNITESRARELLDKSPWTLPGWADELLTRARERPGLGTSEPMRASEFEQRPPEFLSVPRLQWDMASKPEFVSHVENLADLELNADRYLIQSGATRLAMLFSSDDGSYRANPDEIVLSADSPEFMAVMVDDSGHSPASQLVTLWNPTEEVALFDLSTGLISNSSQLSNGKEYAILVSDGLDITPADLPFHHIGGNSHSKRMYRIRGDAELLVSVSLGGEVIWESESGDRHIGRDTQAEPSWTKDINVQILPSNRIDLANSSPVSLSISGLDDETTMTYIRAGSRPLDFEKSESGAYDSARFDVLVRLAPKTPSSELAVKIGLQRDGQLASVTRSAVLSVKGVLRMTDTGWEAVGPSESLSASKAKQYAYRLLHRSFGSSTDFALMEGSVFLRRLWTMPRPLDSVGGYGAPLGIRHPYNWVEDSDLLTVANEIYDRGVVETAMIAGGTLRLYLSQPLEPGELHKMVFWIPGKSPTILTAEESVNLPDGALDSWDVRCPDWFIAEDGFVAISYDGARIGAWWTANPYLRMAEQESAWETAAMLRWMHAPILSRAWFEEVRGLAHQYPGHTLKAWLEEDGLPNGLIYGTEGEAWRAAVRQVFSDWKPEARAATTIIRELGQEPEAVNTFQALRKLLRLDPLLMGRVVHPLRKATQMIEVIGAMRCLVAELPVNAPRFHFGQREKELLDEVSEQMRRDDRFIDSIVRKALPTLDYSNLALPDKNNAQAALNVPPFREYLGLRVLSALLN